MRRTVVLQEILKMHFTEAYGGWQGGRLTQAEAAQIPSDHAWLYYVKAKVRVYRYPDKSLAIFHGPRRLWGTC